jgi:hypothetical protein
MSLMIYKALETIINNIKNKDNKNLKILFILVSILKDMNSLN